MVDLDEMEFDHEGVSILITRWAILSDGGRPSRSRKENRENGGRTRGKWKVRRGGWAAA